MPFAGFDDAMHEVYASYEAYIQCMTSSKQTHKRHRMTISPRGKTCQVTYLAKGLSDFLCEFAYLSPKEHGL